MVVSQDHPLNQSGGPKRGFRYKAARSGRENFQLPQVTLTCFQPDKMKTGGADICAAGQLKKINNFEGVLVPNEGKRIFIENIADIQWG